MPPSINVEMAKGFSPYMVKAIMNGRADEVINLAKTNLAVRRVTQWTSRRSFSRSYSSRSTFRSTSSSLPSRSAWRLG
jgi:hypothetical protein